MSVFVCVCMCIYVYECVLGDVYLCAVDHGGQKDVGSPGARVTGIFGLFNLSIGNRTPIQQVF